MNKFQKLIAVSILIIFSFSACKKAKEDITPPEITILSPANESVVASNDSIWVEVEMRDEDFHEFTLRIEKKNEESYCCPILEFKKHSHGTFEKYTRMLPPAAAGVYRISIDASDHNSNKTRAEALFEVVE